MNRRRIAELLATLIVIGMWVAISVEVSNEMSPAPEQAAVIPTVRAEPVEAAHDRHAASTSSARTVE
jgi:hypothetical protein